MINFSSLNLILLEGLIVIQFLIFQFFNHPYKKRDRQIESGAIPVHAFSTRWTVYLQRIIGTRNIVAWMLSAYYVIGFFVTTVLAIFFFIVVLYNGRIARLEIYLLVINIMWVIDISIYYIYPVKPPVRFKSNQDYVNVRKYYFPWSDRVIGIKYNALPSGHVWVMTSVWIAALLEGNPLFIVFFTANLVIACIVILFTGDHYPVDVISAIFLVISLYALLWLDFSAF